MECYKVLIFELSGKVYAIEIEDIERIISYLGITQLPNAPREVAGVVEYENDVLTVLNLAEVFGLNTLLEDTGDEKIVVLISHGKKLGVKVNSVREVRQICLDELYELPIILSRGNPSFVKKLIKFDGKVIVLLDGKSFFDVAKV